MGFVLGGIRSSGLPARYCFGDGLEEVEMGFRVGELVHLFDLQVSVFLSGSLYDEDRFSDQVHLD